MPGDFLDALLREERNGSFTAKSNYILDSIMGILFHGEQTTAMAMTLMIKFLSETPDALEQVKVWNILLGTPLGVKAWSLFPGFFSLRGSFYLSSQQ